MAPTYSDTFRQNFIRMSVPAKLILVVFLVLFFALTGSLAAILLAMPVYHYDMATLFTIIENPSQTNIGIIKFFQIVQSVTMFLIPALMAAWFFSTNTYVYLKTNRKASGITLFLVLISLFAAIPLLNSVTELNMRLDLPVWLDKLENKMIAMEESAEQLTELFLLSNSTTDLLVNFVMIAILPAIGEEFLFRGVVQQLFSDWTGNHHWGIFISAFLFSFIHFQFYGFIPRLLLGLYFGYLMFWSASIWVPVCAHLINNGIAVVYYHFAAQPVGDTPLDNFGTSTDSNYLLYLSVFLTCLIVGLIYLNEKRGVISRR